MSHKIRTTPKKASSSQGIVERRSAVFCRPPKTMKLECGKELGPITLAYETYGSLDPQASNAVMVFHALSGGAHAAGYHTKEDPKPGWWDGMIGPGKAIDTDKYYVISSNIIGSCYGSTGPSSINPETKKPFGMDFPLFTISDIVHAQRMLLDNLGVQRLLCGLGGSIGGMQAMEWTVAYPDRIFSASPIASTSKRNALSIGLSEAQRQAIMSDPKWNGGDYYRESPPVKGLALARMIGHLTYLSEQAMERKFGRRLQENCTFTSNFSANFEVENYLHYQGRKFVDRFDANSYLYITKASDCFDLSEKWGQGSLFKAFSRTLARFLVISFSSDWLYTTEQSREMVTAMKKAGLEVSFCEIQADHGHDSFLLAQAELGELLSGFLKRMYALSRKELDSFMPASGEEEERKRSCDST